MYGAWTVLQASHHQWAMCRCVCGIVTQKATATVLKYRALGLGPECACGPVWARRRAKKARDNASELSALHEQMHSWLALDPDDCDNWLRLEEAKDYFKEKS